MTSAQEYVTTIFDDSTHELNVSFHIMRAILFRYLIGVNCIFYMALYRILQVSNVLIYPYIIGKNIIHTVRHALRTLPPLDLLNGDCTRNRTFLKYNSYGVNF